MGPTKIRDLVVAGLSNGDSSGTTTINVICSGGQERRGYVISTSISGCWQQVIIQYRGGSNQYANNESVPCYIAGV